MYPLLGTALTTSRLRFASPNTSTGDIPVTLQSTPFRATLYGDVSSWNGITNNGCGMPYGGKLKLRPNMRFNLVPTLRDMDAILPLPASACTLPWPTLTQMAIQMDS